MGSRRRVRHHRVHPLVSALATRPPAIPVAIAFLPKLASPSSRACFADTPATTLLENRPPSNPVCPHSAASRANPVHGTFYRCLPLTKLQVSAIWVPPFQSIQRFNSFVLVYMRMICCLTSLELICGSAIKDPGFASLAGSSSGTQVRTNWLTLDLSTSTRSQGYLNLDLLPLVIACCIL
nr:unnamed protein product [Digitaria exilis]